MLESITKMGAEPFRKIPIHSIAARASTGVQAAGEALSLLILDVLKPAENVCVAMMTCHPLQFAPTLFSPVAYAAKQGIINDDHCSDQRGYGL